MSSATLSSVATLNPLVFGDPLLHTDTDIVALSFALDGSLWSVEESGLLQQWNLQSGKAENSYALGDFETLWCFNHNARLLASAGDGLSVWDPRSGNLLVAIPQDSWVTSIAFHPRKAIVAAGYDEGVVRLWDINQQSLLREMSRHEGAVSALSFSADGSQLASAAEDRLIALWEVDSGNHIGNLEGHKDRIPAMAWSPDGKTLVSAGWDTTARIWDVASLSPILLLNSHATQVWTLALSGDGRWLACADSAPAVHIWDFKERKEVHVLKESGAEIRQLAFSPDGTQLAGGNLGSIHLWEPESGKTLSGSTGSFEPAQAMCLSPNGKTLATSGTWGAKLWDSSNANPLRQLEDSQTVYALAFSPDGKSIAGGTDEHICIWNAESGQCEKTFEARKEPVTALAYSADGAKLASASSSGYAVWIWRVEDAEPILLIPDALDGCLVEALAFHPDGRRLAVGGIEPLADSEATGAVCIWDLQERCEIATLVGGVNCLAFDKTGDRLVTGEDGAFVSVWDADSKELLAELAGHENAVRAVAVSPDGKWLVSGGDDRTLHVWDMETLTAKSMHEHNSQITALAFSSDGRYLFTGNANMTCYRLEVASLIS